MNFSSLLPFTSAALGAALAIAGLLRPNRTISRWAFAVGMLLLSIESLIIAIMSDRLLDAETTLRWQQWRLLPLAGMSGVWILFSLSYSRGDATKMWAQWKFPLIATVLAPLAFAGVFRHSLVNISREDGQTVMHLGWAGIATHCFVLVGSVFVLMNLERTYRASVGTMRWRIKYVLIGAGILFLVRVYTSSQVLLFHGSDPLVDIINSGALLIAAVLFIRSFLRDQDFDPDIYPSQSVLQNSLTALLAGVYLLLVGVFAKIVGFFGGDSAFALKAFLSLVALVLLTLLLQSDHVRLQLRRFVSRHFQRPFYDYRLAWKKFTEGTAACVEQGDLCRALVRLIAETLQSLSVSVWVLDAQKGTFFLAASTSVSKNQGKEPLATETIAVLAHFKNQSEPVDFESLPEPWALALRNWHPAEFTSGGHRVSIPIVGRGEVIGLITLGDRIGGAALTEQDFELLKCACDHAAASLLNVQLSRELLQARELQAFQTMATFFVHDLKNAASTLNLMLQNLPDHFDDPEFREDALRGISKTVTHINHLIGRLGMLRHELKIQSRPNNLIATIQKAIVGLDTGPGFVLTKDLPPLPEFAFDPDQIGKVITNFVLNAIESLVGGGQVTLSASYTDGWSIITIQDTGCGMSPDFISRSLFRPFQTTKKNGLGIGMFQSKMIVEAHGGRIAVASNPGQGTTFQIFLPMRA